MATTTATTMVPVPMVPTVLMVPTATLLPTLMVPTVMVDSPTLIENIDLNSEIHVPAHNDHRKFFHHIGNIVFQKLQ